MELGAFYVWQSVGLVVLSAVEDDFCVFRTLETLGLNVHERYGMERANLPGTVRAPVSKAEAARVVELLRAQHDYAYQRRDEQDCDDTIALAKNTLAGVAERLHRYYRARFAEAWHRAADGCAAIERYVIGELAYVLECNEHRLQAMVRKGHPAFAQDAPARPEDPPRPEPIPPVVVDGVSYVGSFVSADGQMRVGSIRNGENTLVVGHPGTWHVYVGGDGEIPILRAYHERVVHRLSELVPEDVAVLPNTHGRVWIYPADADNEFFFAGRKPPTPIIQNRGCITYSTQREPICVKGAVRAGRLVALHVDAMRESYDDESDDDEADE